MIKIENILVPLDLSEIAKQALTYTQELASAHGARIHLLHVVDPRGMELTGAVGALPTYGGAATDRFEEEAEKALVRARDEIKGLAVESAVRIGSSQRGCGVRAGSRHRHHRHGDARAQWTVTRPDRQRGGEGGADGAVSGTHRQASGARVRPER